MEYQSQRNLKQLANSSGGADWSLASSKPKRLADWGLARSPLAAGSAIRFIQLGRNNRRSCLSGPRPVHQFSLRKPQKQRNPRRCVFNIRNPRKHWTGDRPSLHQNEEDPQTIRQRNRYKPQNNLGLGNGTAPSIGRSPTQDCGPTPNRAVLRRGFDPLHPFH